MSLVKKITQTPETCLSWASQEKYHNLFKNIMSIFLIKCIFYELQLTTDIICPINVIKEQINNIKMSVTSFWQTII